MPISHINYNLRKKTKLGIPLASEGKDGDLQLCVLGSGVGLYGKIRNKWILFGKASISDTSVDAIDNGGNIPVNLNKFIELDGTVFKVKSTAGAKSKKSLITLNENTTVVGDKSSSKFFTIIKVDPNNKAARTKALTAITFLFLNI